MLLSHKLHGIPLKLLAPPGEIDSYTLKSEIQLKLELEEQLHYPKKNSYWVLGGALNSESGLGDCTKFWLTKLPYELTINFILLWIVLYLK